MKAVGKSVVLIMLIIIMVLAGLLWFDYLGVVQAKALFSPLYRVMGRDPQTSKSVTSTVAVVGDMDQERLAKGQEALELERQAVKKLEAEVAQKAAQNEAMASAVANDRKSLEEEQKTFELRVTRYDEKEKNITQIANNLNGMTPQAAVGILTGMDDQLIIDVLRKVEEIAAASGTSSMGSYWLSLMPSDRAATIQRKMLSKAESLD